MVLVSPLSLLSNVAVLTLATALLGFASATRVYVSDPNPSSSWNPGSNVAIKWNNNDGGSPVDLISIDIMDGDAQNANQVAHLADNIPVGVGQYNWIVPVNMEKRGDYFVKITGKGKDGIQYFYSGRYSVDGSVMGATKVQQPWEKNPHKATATGSSAALASAATTQAPPRPTTSSTAQQASLASSSVTSIQTPSSTTSNASTKLSSKPSASPKNDTNDDDDESSAVSLPAGLVSMGAVFLGLIAVSLQFV